MAGLYFHIPFCRKACHYCDFHFSTSLRLRKPMLSAMSTELAFRMPLMVANQLDTIYFGGGTPGYVDPEEIASLIEAARAFKPIAPDAEITLEANPDDISPEKLSKWKVAGINRLSIGIQSFRDSDLNAMNRSHDAQKAFECVRLAQEAGINNITIDLIYGLPHMDEGAWKENVAKAISLNVPHISAYCLTVEPRTALANMITKGQLPDVDEEMAARHYRILVQILSEAGYSHYEVSNFARPGHESRHNSAYWSGALYEGIGPSAHSYDGRTRSWNVANNARYIKQIESGDPDRESETLTSDQQYNEYVLLGLRTARGIDTAEALNRFGRDIQALHHVEIAQWQAEGLMVAQGTVLRLTEDGFFRADGIAGALFS